MTNDVITCQQCGKTFKHSDWYVLLLWAGDHIKACKRKKNDERARVHNR